MRILVIGGGGREAAIVWKLMKEGHSVACAPGNGGIPNSAPGIKAADANELIAFATSERIDLAIVGPEAPLVGGIVDRFRARGIPICGPTAAGAKTEGSKAWFKRFLRRHDIPTAAFEVYAYDNIPDACIAGFIRDRGSMNIVVKADGLCGGKGVFLPEKRQDVYDGCHKLKEQYGDAAGEFVIEERLAGSECSVIAIADGRALYYLPTAQDYKRRDDNDKGPNTGGMGAYTRDLPAETYDHCRMIVGDIFRALRAEEIEYRGFMYVGFMLTDQGPMVLEMNCRLGDPETQAILPSIDDGFGTLCMASATGNLPSIPMPEKKREAVCVNLTSAAYPEKSDVDAPITGIDEAERRSALVFHAGTARNESGYTTNRAGRALSVVGTGATVAEARKIAYAGANVIRFEGKRQRSDIAEGA